MFANYTSAAMSEKSGQDGEKKKVMQYLSIGEIPEEAKQKAQRTSRLQCIQRCAPELMENFDPSDEHIEKIWEECKKKAPSKAVDFWTKQLTWESGPNPPYLQTQFIYNEKEGHLHLVIHNEFMNIQTDLALTTNDKIAMLEIINKDNNRIKSMMEKEKVREYTTESLKPYYDAIRSKELKNGIEWQYIKDGKVIDTAFMSYKELYEIQIGKNSTKCRFCESTETRKYQPTYEDEAIWLCEQHEKYIQRVSQRIHGKAEEV